MLEAVRKSTAAASQPPKLNIGSGRAPQPKAEGWINCDLHPGPGVDYAFDACKPWPFKDGSVARVESNHVLEHLPDPMAFFREAWRVLIPNGQMWLRLPHGWHQSAWWDLTHLRPWLPESFAILQPGFTHFTRNHQHERMGFAFWVVQATVVLERPWARMWRFPFLRPLVKLAGRYLLNVYRDVIVEAFKTTEDDLRSKAYGGEKHPAIVPCSFAVYKHEYYGKSAEGLTHFELITWAGKETGDEG